MGFDGIKENRKSGGSVDLSNYYNKSQVDSLLEGKENSLGFTPEDVSKKGQANGYAGLDEGGKVPSSQLPSYVDDIVEYADLGSFPATGENGKIYIALDSGISYRWSGSGYVAMTDLSGYYTKLEVDSLIGGILGGGSVTTLDTLEIAGTQTTGVVSSYRVGQGGTMNKFSAYLETAPTGANFIVVLKINGTTQATATITAGSNSGTTSTFVSTTLVEGDLVTYEITQIGSTIAGSGLTLILNLA